MKSFLPITISETYSLDLDVVKRIIEEKNLKSNQEVMNFFALNKDKIQSLFQENQIQQIIDEEFLDTQQIKFQIIPSIGVNQSSQASQELLKTYSGFMKEYFPKQRDLFNDESQMHLIWPKYIGSLLISLEDTNSEQLKANQELCIEIGNFELRAKEINQSKKKFSFHVDIDQLYILLYSKTKKYVDFINKYFIFFI